MFKIASENLIFSEVGSHSDIYCKSHNKVGNLQVSSNQMEKTQNMLLVQLWENLESKYYAPMSKINLQHILHMTSNICTYYLRFGGTGPFLEQTSFKRKSWRSSVDHLIFVAELILGDISQLQLLQSDPLVKLGVVELLEFSSIFVCIFIALQGSQLWIHNFGSVVPVEAWCDLCFQYLGFQFWQQLLCWSSVRWELGASGQNFRLSR